MVHQDMVAEAEEAVVLSTTTTEVLMADPEVSKVTLLKETITSNNHNPAVAEHLDLVAEAATAVAAEAAVAEEDVINNLKI